ncbi:MAG: histidinol-phosphatase [Clostridia bacterium]|nr:histidinol-phosphatase [Clostridia bacterium]
MKHNYHTHTFRCKHASGLDRDYVEAAVAAGLETLGFSDHGPYVFPEEAGDFYSGFRMRPEQLEGYVESVESLKAEFKGKIRLLTGVEIEYYPKCFDRTEKFLRDSGIEYLILGQHVFGNEYDKGSIYVAGQNGAGEKELEAYTSLVIGCIESGKFLYVAHPDIFRFEGAPEFYSEQAERMCVAAKKNNLPLEVNLLGFRGGRHYPNRLFWEAAGRTGAPVIFGIDAHAPEMIGDADKAIEDFKKEYKDIELNYIDEELL